MNPRIIESLGLFFAGLVYGLALIFLGLLMTGAGHGIGLFYVLAASPCLYLNNTPMGWLAFCFWPVLFGLLPWCHKRWVFSVSVICLVLHFAGIVYWGIREAESGLDLGLEKLPYAVLFFAILYLTGQSMLIVLLKRWRKRPA